MSDNLNTINNHHCVMLLRYVMIINILYVSINGNLY